MRAMTAALAAALLLAGCAAPPREARESTAPASAPAARVESMSASLVESSALSLPEEEVLAAYELAQRVYGWFDLAPLPVSEEPTMVNGKAYYQVNVRGLEKLEDLRAYLRGVFSRDLTERLLDGEATRIRYRDINGVLCASGESRGRNAGKGQVRIKAEQMEETLYAVNVMVDLLGEDGITVVGLESWSFPYAFVDDRWVFTDFRLVD